MKNERGFVLTVTGVMMCITILALGLALSGCAGELYIGTRRIDRVEQTQVMESKSWYCAYINCGGTQDDK